MENVTCWHKEQIWFLELIRNTVVDRLGVLNVQAPCFLGTLKYRHFVKLRNILDNLAYDEDVRELFDKTAVILSGASINPKAISYKEWVNAGGIPQYSHTYSMGSQAKQILDQLCREWFIGYKKYSREELVTFLRSVYEAVWEAESMALLSSGLPSRMMRVGVDFKQVVSQISSLFNSQPTVLPKDKILWHSGNISCTQNLHSNSPLWTTELRVHRLRYAGLYRLTQSAGFTKAAYCIELKVKKDLRLADFTHTSFSSITNNYCAGIHVFLAYCINQWAFTNGIDALKGTNLGGDEIVVCDPAAHLDVVHATPL